ncbi:MAG: GntR family transcriptional regulator [Lachnospiraceae bacterium]|nr:GntR family transcriptional regulator [Lachnospiraceae bacterium]
MNALLLGKDSGSLRARVFTALESAIINGEYKEGDTLNEIKLSQTLGVSRTPVREALMQLELEGLVEATQNKGAVVIGISEKDIEDIYAIRIRIEGFATELATKNITKDELMALEKIVELQEFYLLKRDTDQLWRLDTDFHKIIYDASRNRSLRAMLTSFHNHIQRGRGITLKVEGRAEKSVKEHKEILEAMKAGDPELASKLTTEHVINASQTFERTESGDFYEEEHDTAVRDGAAPDNGGDPLRAGK